MANFEKLNDSPPTLEALSLDSVVKNFKQFYFAFTESKDARLQRNLEFLQRRFSDKLVCELSKGRDKIHVYFEFSLFLINEHLTSFYFDYRKSTIFSRISNSQFDDVFSRLSSLRRIQISSRADEILESITKFCPKIIEISASNSDISDDGVRHLCEMKNGRPLCPELKDIDIKWSRVSEEGVKCLIKNLPSIERLKHKSLLIVLHSIYQENVFGHQNVPFLNLTELSFSEITGEILDACFAVCPKLESISLYSVKKIEPLNVIINHNICLKKLTLSCFDSLLELYFNVDGGDSSLFQCNIDKFLEASGRRLTALTVCGCTLSLSALAAHCPALQEFKAYTVNFADDAGDVQLFFPSLTSCVLPLQIPKVLKAFRLLSFSSPKLESVHFQFSPNFVMSSEMKNQILTWCKNSAAKRIQLDKVDIEMSFLKEIFLNCASLELLKLYCCSYDVHNPKKTLKSLAIEHPKKPVVMVQIEHRMSWPVTRYIKFV